MKNLLPLLAVTALLLSVDGFAAEKPSEPAPAPAAPAKVAGEVKTIPMHSRADSIDTTARTFTTKRKDGVEVKHVITAGTEIKQGATTARLEDIKVGDYVSGSRRKVNDTEYTVVKITKFGPKAATAKTAN